MCRPLRSCSGKPQRSKGVRPLGFNELLGDPEAGDPEKEDIDDFIATAG
ncbi:MAG: hypothetical protein WKF84_10370 [Pyrinomonadaceae bacterium]